MRSVPPAVAGGSFLLKKAGSHKTHPLPQVVLTLLVIENHQRKRKELMIDNMHDSDWEQVRSIYLEGIATGHATFETSAPEWDKWNADHLVEPRLVYREGEKICGWAALSRVSGRCVYGGVAEVSVYVAGDCRGRGLGRELLTALIERSELAGIWTLQAGIFPENHASIELHNKCGFRLVGTRERLGRMAGVWRDVVLLERRSKVVGAD